MNLISPISDRPDDFFRWAVTNADIWRPLFPDLQIEPGDFVPRPLFGLYLESLIGDIMQTAADADLTFIPIQAEAEQISLADNGVVIRTRRAAIRTDYTLLCCGTLGSSEYAHLRGNERFFASPYPIASLVRQMPDRQATIGVIGSRLSAVDAILGLARGGHEGRIVCVSRHGRLPTVRGAQPPYRLQVLNREAVRRRVAAHGAFALADVAGLVQQEIALAQGRAFNLDEIMRPELDPQAYLEHEIAAAAAPRPWQAVLYGLNGSIDLIWHHLRRTEKAKLLQQHFGLWMYYRVAMPLENAERLLQLMRSGQLVVRPGFAGFEYDQASKSFLLQAGRDTGATALRTDVLINSTGSPREAHKLDSPLLQRALEAGICRAHRFGGIDVSFPASNVISTNGQVQRSLYALGGLTCGVNLFTSALEINARQAKTCVDHLMRALKARARLEQSVAAVPLRQVRRAPMPVGELLAGHS